MWVCVGPTRLPSCLHMEFMSRAHSLSFSSFILSMKFGLEWENRELLQHIPMTGADLGTQSGGSQVSRSDPASSVH